MDSIYLKQRIEAGECLMGACIYSNSPAMIEYSAAGMDWIWWEAQHTHPDWSVMVHGVRTANMMGIPLLVRTWTHDPGTIEKLLDMGAEGIIVPMVNTPEQAREIVSHCYYPPVGVRSYGSIRTERIETDLDEWNKRIVTIMQIETPEAVENAEAIAGVPGVDGLHLGARDLALRLHKDADNYNAMTVVAPQLDRVVKACGNAGKAAAIIAFSPASVQESVGKGYRLICAGADVEHVAAAHRRMKEAFEEAIRESRD